MLRSNFSLKGLAMSIPGGDGVLAVPRGTYLLHVSVNAPVGSDLQPDNRERNFTDELLLCTSNPGGEDRNNCPKPFY